MSFSVAARNNAVDGVTGGASGANKYISLHESDPGTTGAGEVTGGSYARVATTWPSASSGSATGSQVTINVPAGTTITHWGCWDQSSSGAFQEGGALSSSETYGADGTYLFTPTISA